MEERYSRHILLQDFGAEGQAKLSKAKVAIVGCGGLGCLVATYLAGAGVKSLTLIDGDTPDISNLHRQVMYISGETQPKSITLADRLKSLNPNVTYNSYTDHLTKLNIEDYLDNVDLVVECTDDQTCKYLVNDYCVLEEIPMIYGAIHKYEGYVSVFANQNEKDVHLRDLFPQPDLNIPTCAEVGVLSTTAGLISMLQANEAIKYLSGVGQCLIGKLLTYQVLENRQMTLVIKKTWKGDIEDLYEKTAYTPTDCLIVPSLSIEDIAHHRNTYTLISILPPEENKIIDADTISLDPSDYDQMIALAQKKPCVIYCRSGKQTKTIVSNLLLKHPTLSVANLEGGYLSFQKFKALH